MRLCKSKKRKKSEKRKNRQYVIRAVVFEVVTLAALFIAVWIFFEWEDRVQAGMPDKPSAYSTVDEEGVFHIYNEKDWWAFCFYVDNGYESLDAVLEEDIIVEKNRGLGLRYSEVLEEDIIVEKNKYVIPDHFYAGHFSGQGHKMEISARRCGMFSILEAEGVIEDITLEVSVSSFDGEGAGGIVRYNYGTIRDCNVYGSIKGHDGYAGGIAEANLGQIENCCNYAAVTSFEGGETWQDNGHLVCSYGAGGIAGLSAGSVREENVPENCAIVNCSNYGDVTALAYAGGIAARVEDRTSGEAAVSSVQELVQYEDFTAPSEMELPEESGNILQEKEEPDRHYSLSGCTNYGTVMVNRGGYGRTLSDTQAAGICADLKWGDIYRCVNRGKVRNLPIYIYTENGISYTNRPVAIAPNMGFAPTPQHHIIECVSLKGTVERTMRYENIMELSEEELSAWEAGNYTGEYISNNWEFDLEEAVDVCGLEPLGIGESSVSAVRGDYYLCEEFALFLPGYLEIEEVCLPDREVGVCYALHIQVRDKSSAETGIDQEDECWILRTSTDVQEALAQAKESNTRNEWRVRYFVEEVYDTIPLSYHLRISPLNLPFHDCYQTGYASGKRIYMESSIPDQNQNQYMGEGGHTLGNVLAMPLEGAGASDVRDGLSARWLMLFTRKNTNIRPSRTFISLVEEGFYPLDGEEEPYELETGDSLWKLAKACTGDPGNWKVLADMNGISDQNSIFAGDTLILPAREKWDDKLRRLTPEWICGDTAGAEGGER